ncbi:hypothetical protein BDM02DRAFT_3263335 [Thelephora ganbajun]|uniref:Uncharacterized protein n=1 Tax=Thelephora ganbajun TaxID=370292 RepID=A0ACB6Z5M4_THEGA|nr:hypothetical protein BDM02DRAFT_3263335 [Thelephora ganbajun]
MGRDKTFRVEPHIPSLMATHPARSYGLAISSERWGSANCQAEPAIGTLLCNIYVFYLLEDLGSPEPYVAQPNRELWIPPPRIAGQPLPVLHQPHRGHTPIEVAR